MKYGARSLKTLYGIHPNLIYVLMEAINDSPYDYTITNGVRSTKEQQALYALGRTTENHDGKTAKRPLGFTVTDKNGVTNKSNHQPKADGFGYAVDLYPYVNGTVDLHNKSGRQKAIAEHILKTATDLGIKVIWGGTWVTRPDAPHFELG